MAATRREFLKIAGVSAVGLLLPPFSSPAAARAGVPAAGSVSPQRVLLRRSRPSAGPWRSTAGNVPPAAGIVSTPAIWSHNVPAISATPRMTFTGSVSSGSSTSFPRRPIPVLPESLKGLPVPVLCNHCENPPCVRVCPTKATFKRADGIVMMDYHRCIGCRFCMAACPYGSRSMNYRDPRPFIRKLNPEFPTRTKGVVEKCNFCEERLARGLLPACVLACKEKALVFGDLEDPRSDIRLVLGKGLSLRRRPELGTGPQVYYLL